MTHRGSRHRLGVWIALLVVISCSGLASAARAGTSPTASCVGPDAPSAAHVVNGDDADGVLRIVFTFVDHARQADPDEPDADADAGRCRVLTTTVSVPVGATAPLPLILAVHGRDGDPARLGPLVDTWVRTGTIVAAPKFLVTEKDGNDKPTAAAVRRQTDDARFVLDQLLAENDDPTSRLHGLIDRTRIGAVGMSLGGMTVYGLVSNTCCRDRRITAAVLLAAVRRDFDSGRFVTQRIPVMLIQGDADDGYHNSVTAYPNLAAPKWFITLHGSTHSPPFEVPRGPEAPLVDQATTGFWQLYLGGQPTGGQQIIDAVAASSSASLQRQLASR